MPGTWPRPSSAISRSSRPSITPSSDPSSMPSFTSSRPLPPTRSTRSSPSATFSPAIVSKPQPENPLSGLCIFGGSGRTGTTASRNSAAVACRSSGPRLPLVHRQGSGACQDTRRSNRPCATTTSTPSVSRDSMSLPKFNPVEPPWYGPVCLVVWEGRHREVSPYPDHPPNDRGNLADRFGAQAGRILNGRDLRRDLAGCMGCLDRQILDLVGDDREALAGLSGP